MDSRTGGTPSRPPSTTPLPIREDCWSEDATFTLIEAWGDRYLELNRGNLRQKHWQEVADAVNDLHGHVSSKSYRTDIQCKNRIDTLKKKYKIEKARVLDSNAAYTSQWPFFDRLDFLLGSNFPAKTPSPLLLTGTPTTTSRRTPPLASPSWFNSPVPVGIRSSKRSARPPSPVTMAPAPLAVDDSHVHRNFSAFAAAAAAAAADAAAEDSDGSGSGSSFGSKRREREEGYRELAQAIERLGDIYERVESQKQKQMVELEKQRMQFTKELECQRMQLFMETQLQLQKIKRLKPSNTTGPESYLSALR